MASTDGGSDGMTDGRLAGIPQVALDRAATLGYPADLLISALEDDALCAWLAEKGIVVREAGAQGGYARDTRPGADDFAAARTLPTWDKQVDAAVSVFLGKMARAGNPGIRAFKLYDTRTGKLERSLITRRAQVIRGWPFPLGGLHGRGIIGQDGRLYSEVQRDYAGEKSADRLFEYSESGHGRSGNWPIDDVIGALAGIAYENDVA